MKTSAVDGTLNELAEQWRGAKIAEKQWNEYRKSLEARILEACSDEVAQALASLEDRSKLTTTISLAGLNVAVGHELKAPQPLIMEFLSKHPRMLGVLFKAEYKPDTRAVLNTLALGSDIAKELDEIIEFRAKTPSFSAKV